MNEKIIELLKKFGITPAPNVDLDTAEQIRKQEVKWSTERKRFPATTRSTQWEIDMMRKQLNAELRQLQRKDSSSTRPRVELILRSAGRYDDEDIQALIAAIRTKLNGG